MLFKGLLFLSGVIFCTRLPVLPACLVRIRVVPGCLAHLEISRLQVPRLRYLRLSLDIVERPPGAAA